MNRAVAAAVAPSPVPLADPVRIRPAAATDAGALYRLITDNIETGHLLPRPLSEVKSHAPRFLVAAGPAGVVGCAELTPLSPRLCEVRSLVVAAGSRGQGVGTRLLQAVIGQAGARRVPRVCAFAHDPRPFIRLGFSIVPHPWLPDKIAADCVRCPWFRRCAQYAVILDLDPAGAA